MRAPEAPNRTSCASARVRGEKVRLAGAVGARHEDQSGLQRELEPLVGTELAEQHLADDQLRSVFLTREANRHDQIGEVPGRVDENGRS